MGPWAVFIGVASVLLIFDLWLLTHRKEVFGVKESLYLSAFYIGASLLFGLYVGYAQGSVSMTNYYTGYLVEQSLSLDNLFVFSLIFNYFAVPKAYQRRVLFWGIVGVFILRGVMILAGSTLVSSFSWMLYVFGIFLVFMGIKILIVKQKEEMDLENNLVLKGIKKFFTVTRDFHGDRFIYQGKFTPLFVVLIMIDIADIIFAVDSIPAIFAITTDTYVVYTSNMFAILGLRALYFALDAILGRFVYLQQALGCILIFIGFKVFIHGVTPLVSLGVTFGILLLGILLSLWKTQYGKTIQKN